MSESKTHKLPIWIHKQIDWDGAKICTIIVELPDDPYLSWIDKSGQFKGAIVDQMLNILKAYNGTATSNVLVRSDAKINNNAIYTSDCDILLMHFIKHYQCSTQTASAFLNDVEFKKYVERSATDKIIKNSTPVLKIDGILMISKNMINIGINSSTKEFDISKVPTVI
jgi:hypothetical protein